MSVKTTGEEIKLKVEQLRKDLKKQRFDTLWLQIFGDLGITKIYQSGVCLPPLKKHLGPILSCQFLEYAGN